MHSLSVPSFSSAITIPAAYGLELILITSFANMVRNCSQTFDRKASGVRLDRMLTGGLSPGLIKCFTSTTRPRFPSLLEKRLSCSNSYIVVEKQYDVCLVISDLDQTHHMVR